MSEALFPKLPVLLIDDETTWLNSLAMSLEYSGGINHVIQCSDSREAMSLLAEQEVGLILLDLTMPHLSGEQLLGMIIQNHPEVPVIILSGMNQIETAVKCIKSGAFDYFVKTVEMERLIAGIQRAFAMRELQRENRLLKAQVLHDELKHPKHFSRIITVNRKMRALFKYVEAVSGSSEPLLITGESGVGKELFARASHDISRPGKPWVAVNAAGLDDNVFADTLFGHARGAYTGADQARPGMIEQAASGTLFLDEIGDLNPTSQVKLLRLLQEGEFFPLGSDKPKRLEARVVCATNQDLEKRLADGAFRKDLYYRLCAHQVQIPPLRDRKDDIPLLLDHFLQEAADSLNKKPPTSPEELEILLSTYHFPGNVREFRAMVYNAVSTHAAGKLSMTTFKQVIGNQQPADHPGKKAIFKGPLLRFTQQLPTLEQGAQLIVEEALERSRGNQAIAAGMLGISRQALNKRVKKMAE